MTETPLPSPFSFSAVLSALLCTAGCFASAQDALPQSQDPKPAKIGQLADNNSPLRIAKEDEGDRDLRMTPVVRAVQKAADSVVNVDIVGQQRPAAVRFGTDQRQVTGQGSGVILDEQGLLITNWHVVLPILQNPDSFGVEVRLRDGRKFRGQVLSHSAADDLALIQLDLPKETLLVPAEIADSEDLMVGETVIAIGNPRGQANTVTQGVLSAIDREITVRAPDGQSRTYQHLLQTDAAINQGNSGGALLDITGRLIGINNAMAYGVENMGFAIPVNRMREVFEDTLITQTWASAWLGMQVGSSATGPVVAAIDDYGPAARSGVQVGDLILAAEDQKIETNVEYARVLVGIRGDRPVRLTIERDEQAIPFEITPMDRLSSQLHRHAGFEIEEVSLQDSREFVLKVSQKALPPNPWSRRPQVFTQVLRVTGVDPDGPAATLGVEVGDVFLGFEGGRNDRFTTSRADLAKALRSMAGREVRVLIDRPDRERTMAGPIKLR